MITIYCLKTRFEDFKIARSLFDVASCKCKMTVNCTCQKTTDACQCAILFALSKNKEDSCPQVKVHVSSQELQFGENRLYWQDSYKKIKNLKAEWKSRDLLQQALSGKEVPKIGEHLETGENDEQSSTEDSEHEEDEYKYT